MRRAYFGALSALAEVSMYIEGRGSEKRRRLIERECRRAERLIPGFKWTRSINTILVWMDDDEDG